MNAFKVRILCIYTGKMWKWRSWRIEIITEKLENRNGYREVWVQYSGGEAAVMDTWGQGANVSSNVFCPKPASGSCSSRAFFWVDAGWCMLVPVSVFLSQQQQGATWRCALPLAFPPAMARDAVGFPLTKIQNENMDSACTPRCHMHRSWLLVFSAFSGSSSDSSFYSVPGESLPP